MDQQARLRELLIMQLGSQVLQMCELQAKLDVAIAELEKQAKFLADLRAEKAGVSAT